MLALKFENVGKQYRLGEVGRQTIARDLESAWSALRGKADPRLSKGLVNDRAVAGGEYIWALRDINLELEQGEVFGIIGQNGAGKSTLLKLLSRVTSPTTGKILTRGRIASLLEVGTGFHPELTGRENIFLNGAILGMSKPEVRKHLDAIIEFSGCAKYIDTPVKRYSSGMMVRLGFAVAAHLEGEILVVDEVLAVGDDAFQRKCIGRMNDVASEGKSVLFVSHNMQSVERLCTRACVLDKGEMLMIGDVHDAIARYFGTYMDDEFCETSFVDNPQLRRGSGKVRFATVGIQDENGKEVTTVDRGTQTRFVFNVTAYESVERLRLVVKMHSGLSRQEVTSLEQIVCDRPLHAGDKATVAVEFDSQMFRPGIYPLLYQLDDGEPGSAPFDVLDKATRPFSVVTDGSGRAKGLFDPDSHVVEEPSQTFAAQARNSG